MSKYHKLEHSADAKKLYNSIQWRKTRQAYLDTVNHLCELCHSVAEHVHHIEEINSTNVHNASVTLNQANLQALCIPCHNRVTHQVHSPTREDVSFNIYGELIHTGRERE